jgi:hypothetical protein
MIPFFKFLLHLLGVLLQRYAFFKIFFYYKYIKIIFFLKIIFNTNILKQFKTLKKINLKTKFKTFKSTIELYFQISY